MNSLRLKRARQRSVKAAAWEVGMDLGIGMGRARSAGLRLDDASVFACWMRKAVARVISDEVGLRERANS